MDADWKVIGQPMKRVDAYDKATGRTKYTDDLCPNNALIAKIARSTIAHGYVKSIDTSEAEKIPGVVKIVTCFDVPDLPFGTAGHPWTTDPTAHSDMDRHLLNQHVRLYGDEVAAVIAQDEVSAQQGVDALKIEYEELPFVLDPMEAIKDGAPQLFDNKPHNIGGENHEEAGDYDAAIQEEGLQIVDDWFDLPVVQHCHIENHTCFAYMENGRIVLTTSTQIPHIVRRVCAQALGLPWGKLRVIKPYVGGGFGNKQDVLNEPLCCFLTTQVGGRCVWLQNSREETFIATRVRHALKAHLISHFRKDGTIVARYLDIFCQQGGYTSHGHAVTANMVTCFMNLYPLAARRGSSYTIYTNTPTAGAMRGYGYPQATFIQEAHTDNIAAALHMDPIEVRRKNMLPNGYWEAGYKMGNYFDSLNQVINRGKALMHWDEKRKQNAAQTGMVRRGLGMAIFYYYAGVWPYALESCSCRMILNQDGSVQVQLGEVEIGQGADTAFTQMTSEVLGIPCEDVHIVSCQDTDVTPYGQGAYASRQSYVAGYGIRKTGEELKRKILQCATRMTRQPGYLLDIIDGNIVRLSDNQILMSLGTLATETLYSLEFSQHITAETTANVQSNAFTFGCCFAEVEVDIPLCKVKVVDILNVHDCGKLINPALAEAQVHGGMSMAIGYGVSEELLFDPKTGKPRNNNLLDYKLSTIMDHPHLKAEFIETNEPESPFGNRSLGEPPTCPGGPAIRNAVLDATGLQINKMPITPHVLYERFVEAGLL